ncbi:sulfite exporter TauE/SafE family protein [Maritalea mobilis]|uniref:sulfite exporter TauE/SafE family protein n=1 Tax=Maritalea mobilis TaxID=483324 RepID=UPI001C93F68A|nr:sulfite exporter TauE/SafE family protein [Maritalea mobilis]MBY6200551.1 sulfite exporter TauE/SafE family protein [Maritalea mobilis]
MPHHLLTLEWILTLTLLSHTDIALLIVGVIIAAGLGGLLAGLLGVGGGIVIVPVLFWVFTFTQFDPALSMHMAVATSLATIVATSFSSARAHHRRGAVDMSIVRRWGPWLALGALSGGALAGGMDSSALMVVFGLVGLAVSVNFLLPKTLVVAADLPHGHARQPGIAFAIGTVSALMGIGGGTLGVPTLTAFSVPVHRAVGTASSFGLIIAVPAVVALIVAGLDVEGRPPLSLGYVNLVAAALILPISTSLAPQGARLAHALDAKWVKRAFAVFLALTSLRMLWTALS